jgi:hypothetical protein
MANASSVRLASRSTVCDCSGPLPQGGRECRTGREPRSYSILLISLSGGRPAVKGVLAPRPPAVGEAQGQAEG